MKKFVKILSLSLVAVMLLAMLASCAPASDPDKADQALDEKGYIVVKDTKVIPAIYKALGYDLDAVVTGAKTATDKDSNKTIEYITIYYFANKEDAEKAYEKVKSDEKEDKKKNQEKNADAKEASTWVSATKSGKMIYFGTKQGVKDAR